VSWGEVLQLEVVNCLLDPAGFPPAPAVYVDTAMDELLGTDLRRGRQGPLYRCLDRVLPQTELLFG